MTEPLQTLVSRFLALFRRRSLDLDLDAELRSHVDMAIEQNLQNGMGIEQARREALLAFGGLEQTKQIYRERRAFLLIETTFQDLRFALRMLRRSPGFAVIAIYVPYARHQCQCCRVQLGGRHSFPALSPRFSSGAPGRTVWDGG